MAVVVCANPACGNFCLISCGGGVAGTSLFSRQTSVERTSPVWQRYLWYGGDAWRVDEWSVVAALGSKCDVFGQCRGCTDWLGVDVVEIKKC